MRKITLIFFFLLFPMNNLEAEIYSPNTIEEIKDIAEDVFAKRNAEKALFIFPLENFILTPIHPALKRQDTSYNSILKKAFSKAKTSKSDYIDELILMEYPHKLSSPKIADLIDYIQENKAGIIIITPNLSGPINDIDYFDIWTFDYLKKHNIDLSKGVFADTKIIFNKELKEVAGTYPTFYKGLLSYNTDGKNNSSMQTLSVLLRGKLTKMPNIIFAVSMNKNYLEALEKQVKTLKPDVEFFGILYSAKIEQNKNISPSEYLSFWQNFVTKLNNVKRKNIDLETENPYES